MTVQEWLAQATMRLSAAGIESARLDAQLIAARTLGQDRSWVLAHPDDDFDEAAAEPMLDRRVSREPLAYILGSREFYGRDFLVRPGVLVPRQETECLVEAVLDLMRLEPGLRRIVDVGCGSGCIAITLSLALFGPVIGLDVADVALEVTAENNERLGAMVTTLKSDRLAALEDASIDLLVSNPPYIVEGETLMPEVGEFEPKEALFAGADGLDAYRWLAEDGRRVVVPGGWVSVEVGAGQAEDVKAVFAAHNWSFIRSVMDLSRIERALSFRAPWVQ